MSLMRRQRSPVQSEASRINGRRSRGPQTARGKALARRNLTPARPFSQVVARSLTALGESREDFEQRHQALAAAMEPRDAWEAAWVQDIAALRWRLERLQRAEAGVTALQRRRLDYQRRCATLPPAGYTALQQNNLTGIYGFTGLPDSALKFRQVLDLLRGLRTIVELATFDEDVSPYFSLLYGEASGPEAVALRARFDSIAGEQKEGNAKEVAKLREALLETLNEEVEKWEQLQAEFVADQLLADQVKHDAELLLPGAELDQIIRYETHLEDQIERKLRQFYARRRESVAHPAEALAETDDELSAGGEEVLSPGAEEAPAPAEEALPVAEDEVLSPAARDVPPAIAQQSAATAEVEASPAAGPSVMPQAQSAPTGEVLLQASAAGTGG